MRNNLNEQLQGTDWLTRGTTEYYQLLQKDVNEKWKNVHKVLLTEKMVITACVVENHFFCVENHTNVYIPFSQIVLEG